MDGPRPVSGDLTLKYGVPIGQTIDFQDARVEIIGAYPGQVRCKLHELDPRTREPTGRTRTRTVPRSEYDGWVRDSKPRAPRSDAASAAPGRRVKIMRISPSGNPAVVWEDADFEKLAAGDVFMVIEADGMEVPGGPWLTRGGAYRSDGGWTVDCDALQPEDLVGTSENVPSGDPDLVL